MRQLFSPGRRVVHHSRSLVFAGVFLAAGAALAAVHDVRVGQGGPTFSPANLTIQTGDSVRFIYTSSPGTPDYATGSTAGASHHTRGTSAVAHNVRADNGSFRCAVDCGASSEPSNVSWTATVVFNSPGTVRYHCEVHGGPGGAGMSGVITVQGAAGAPGELRFTSSAFSVNENAGQRTITVERTGGTSGAVGVAYGTADGSATSADYGPAAGQLSWANGDGGGKSFVVNVTNDALVEPSETVNLLLTAPTGGATLGSPSTATLTIADDDGPQGAGALAFTASGFSVSEAGGSAAIAVSRSGGSAGAVSVDYATSDGSADAGADYTQTTGTLTFPSGDTADKTINVPILEDAVQEGSETVNLALSDPSGGATLGASTATLTINDNDFVPGVCTANATTLCLNDQRFQVRVTWRDHQDATGVGSAVALEGREDSGLFYFFRSSNLELLIKVLDACGFNDHFWVFFAATTDVEFEVTVLDTDTGAERKYRNPRGQRANAITDTGAFATCP